MDSEYLQFVRYKLQKRLKRLNTAEPKTFGPVLRQVWNWLHENELFSGILQDLAVRFPEAQKWVEESREGKLTFGETEEQSEAICYYLLRECVADPGFAISAGRKCTHHTSPYRATSIRDREDNSDDYLNTFLDVFVEPFFDYLDEQIDGKRAILSLLIKFKHRCEWFHREQLYTEFKEGTAVGERSLAMRLYEYLHDQGLQFQIEPQSAGGRVDLLSQQSGRDKTVADAKLFNPERGQDRAYIIKGFRQVYDYTRDYNEQFGYLVIFKTCEEDLCLPTKHQEAAVPFISHNNKTIFLLVIDIYDYEKSASKRGKLRSYEISPEEFILGLGDGVEVPA